MRKVIKYERGRDRFVPPTYSLGPVGVRPLVLSFGTLGPVETDSQKSETHGTTFPLSVRRRTITSRPNVPRFHHLSPTLHMWATLNPVEVGEP